jgi:RHS repeat-associated protein
VRQITDKNGIVLGRFDYTPFGAVTCSAPSGGTACSSPDPRQFAEAERDKENGLDYLGARYYANQIGRFTAVDPGHVAGDISNPQSWNGYTYAQNNPLRFADPLGTEPCQIALSGEAAAAAGVANGTFVEGECVFAKDPRPSLVTRINDYVNALLELIPFTQGVGSDVPGEDSPFPRTPRESTANPYAVTAAAMAFPLARGTTLAKMLQSEAGVAQLLAGGGEAFAGAGFKREIDDLPRLLRQYGGKPEHWVKIKSTTPGLRTHAYKNLDTGVVVELKSKISYE